MIGQLIRTEVSGNLNTLIGLTVCSLLGLLLFVFTTGMRELGPVIAFTLIPLGVAGIFTSIRAKRERRERLLAQLPVTQLQIILAEWSFAFLLILIPGSILVIAGLLHADYTAFEVLRNFFVFFCVITTVLAALAIVVSIGKLPQPYSTVFQWLWILLVLLFLAVAPISIDTKSFFFSAPGTPNWTLIASFYGISSLSLLGTNIWLHQRAEDYLGN